MTDKERAEMLKNLFAQADVKYRKAKHDLYNDAYNARSFHNAEPEFDLNSLLFNFNNIDAEKRTNKRRRTPFSGKEQFEQDYPFNAKDIFTNPENHTFTGGGRQWGKTYEAKQDKFYTNCDIVTRTEPKKHTLTTKDAKEYTQFTVPF